MQTFDVLYKVEGRNQVVLTVALAPKDAKPVESRGFGATLTKIRALDFDDAVQLLIHRVKKPQMRG